MLNVSSVNVMLLYCILYIFIHHNKQTDSKTMTDTNHIAETPPPNHKSNLCAPPNKAYSTNALVNSYLFSSGYAYKFTLNAYCFCTVSFAQLLFCFASLKTD